MVLLPILFTIWFTENRIRIQIKNINDLKSSNKLFKIDSPRIEDCFGLQKEEKI